MSPNNMPLRCIDVPGIGEFANTDDLLMAIEAQAMLVEDASPETAELLRAFAASLTAAETTFVRRFE